MKVLNYAGSEFVTGDDIAAALMRYSEALADDQTAATVSIPVRAPDGTDGIATFLVGPASQIVATDAADGEDELSDPDVVELLESLTQALASRLHIVRRRAGSSAERSMGRRDLNPPLVTLTERPFRVAAPT